jgi:predicted nucleic acid-binding protein
VICYFDTSALVKIYHLDLINRQGLRTLDALHLASALLLRPLNITFVCADNQLLEAAVHEGLSGLNPEQSI